MNLDQSPESGPYRTPPAKAARFVCTVCYRTATTDEAGECPCAGAPRLPLDNPEVVEMVRAKVAAIRRRRLGWKIGGAIAASVAIALGICLALGLSIDPTVGGAFHAKDSAFTWIAGLLILVLGGLVVTYLDRSPPDDTQGLLKWLGVRIEP